LLRRTTRKILGAVLALELAAGYKAFGSEGGAGEDLATAFFLVAHRSDARCD